MCVMAWGGASMPARPRRTRVRRRPSGPHPSCHTPCLPLAAAAPLPPPQRGKDANDLLASLFTWAVGRAVAPAAVERCFPLVPHGKVLMPYVLWDRIGELGEPGCSPACP